MVEEEEDKAIETKAHLDFPEQIIACHARHTVICNNKIHFHFLEKHKKKTKKFRYPGKIRRKKAGNLRHPERERGLKRIIPDDCLGKQRMYLGCFGHLHANPEILEP
jgi:hypothetical protein